MDKPREKQEKALRFIEEAVRRGFKHIVLEAPTGFGKSAVGVAACSWKEGYYLVAQKLLQDQLAESFTQPPHNVAILKNASEYECSAAKNCALGKATKKCKSKICEYDMARELFKASPRAVTNYPFFLTAMAFGKMDKRPLAVYDECFPGSVQVKTVNGWQSIRSIHEAVETGTDVVVMSHNHGRLVPRKVTKSYVRDPKPLVKIHVYGGTVIVTPDHRFLTTSGWKAAKNLTSKDSIIGVRQGKGLPHNLSDDQLQIVIGSYLGDGHLEKTKNAWRLKVTHGEAQRQYAQWKSDMFLTSLEDIPENGYAQTPAVYLQSLTFNLQHRVQSGAKFGIPKWMLDKGDARALAVWFMDDGCLSMRDTRIVGACIATNSFSKSSVDRLIQWMLKKFGIVGSRSKSRVGHVISLSRDSAHTLVDLIRPYCHPSMARKVANEIFRPYKWTPGFGLDSIPVYSVKPVKISERLYDLSVDADHNFVVRCGSGHSRNSQSFTGLVAHNCHGLERQIIRFVDLTITEDTLERWACELRKVPQLQSIEDYVRWVKEKYLPELQAHHQMLCQLAGGEGQGIDDEDAKKIFEVENHLNQVRRAINEIQNNPRGWVYWQEIDKNGKLVSIARPIHAAPFAKSVIFDSTDIHIHMSAFPGEKNVYCRSLGLNPDQVAWASFGSTFPVNNRPNVMCSLGSMSMRNVDATLPAVLKFIERVLDKHANEKGLIHTHSYKLGQAIAKHFQSTDYWPRFLFPGSGDERDAAYTKHKTGAEPTVLISPSMTEGFDFPGDTARFQIICKCPYPSLGDLQVKAKKDDDPLWYKLETIKTIVQAAGRICRFEEDYGVTYLLDSDIDRLFNDCGQYLPGWFSKAMVWPRK